MELLARLFDITKLPSKVFAWLALLSGVYVLSPNSLLELVHLDRLPVEYKSYAGAIFVAASSFLIINGFLWSWQKVIHFFRARATRKSVRQAILELDADEIAVLREFYIQDKHVIELPVDHPTVAGLRNKRIVLLASNAGYRDLAGSVFPVQLSEYAKSLITQETLRLPENPTEQDMDRIRAERPNYISQIQKTDRLRGGLHW